MKLTETKKITGPLLKEVNLKPVLPFVATLGLGGILVFTKSFPWVAFGLTLIILISLMYWKFPDRKIAEVYEDGLVIFESEDQAVEILWDEITLWHYDEKQVGEDTLRIELADGEIVLVPLYARGYLVKMLNKKRPDQDYQKIKLSQLSGKVRSLLKKK